MKKILLSFMVALNAMSFTVSAQANTFEDIGTVQSVQLGSNIVSINDIFYSLPNRVQLDGAAAILKLKPGYLVGFSGSLAAPNNIIESLYIYPDSVREVEQGLYERAGDLEGGGTQQ